MKIWIKGAGDLATGIASRLYHCGHQILMTELSVPLTVRRTVALSRAVYEKKAVVEDMCGVLAETMQDVKEIQEDGNIAVIVESTEVILAQYQPDVVVDAILAKRNLGTKISEAPFVVGVGPGFTAGKDCHCVVETKRGHTLGNVIWEGTAIPNTGIPGNVGGYTIERLIRASAAGKMEPKAQIGERVEEGQIVAVTGGVPVYARMTGIVRGMLQEGVQVAEGLKIGDIDARCEKKNCYTISDKARSVGGGVLEAISQFEHIQRNYAVTVLAAGAGQRYGGNKLLEPVRGKAMYQYMLEKLDGFKGFPCYIVTGTKEIAEQAEEKGIRPVENHNPEKGISYSLRLGLKQCMEEHPDIKGILFTVCDQPNLTFSSMYELIRKALLHPGKIVCAGNNGNPCNPVFWDRRYFDGLLKLEGDVGGKALLRQYPEQVLVVEVKQEELRDIDRRVDLEEID